MVVDDTPEVRKLIRAVLWSIGIKAVEEASNGMEALSLLKKQHATGKKETAKTDLVLCDIHMEKMDGISLLKEIRNMEETRDLPVIMMSGDSVADRILEAARAGADDFITKPYTVKIIEEKVRKVLEQKRMQDSRCRLQEPGYRQGKLTS